MKNALLKYKKQIMIAALVTFVVAEAAFYLVIHLAPFRYFTPFAYASVALAFVFSFLPLAYGGKRYDWLMRLGFLFTLGADYCLVILTPQESLLGVCIFIPAQLSYAAYIAFVSAEERRGLLKPQLYIRAAVTAVAVAGAFTVLGSGADALAVVSVVYFAQLACNLVFSFFLRRLRLMSIGLIFFALCDLSVGFDNLALNYLGATEGSFLYFITSIDVNRAWIFYPFSQVLIAVSLLNFKNILDKGE